MNSFIEQEVAELGIEAYLNQHQRKSLLRFLTCGSVDDGKSTLIGRLLHDSQQIYEDQLAAIHADSQKVGTTGEKIDLALLVDGLQAEREQGITIDVAYRYFSTQTRKFIISDTPGHEQYTRNMATGASTCDLAVILIDARKGILDQTRRHSFIANLLGIRQFIVAINKMDLVDFDSNRFKTIETQYLTFAKNLDPKIQIQTIPLSALDGDNVVERSPRMPWYQGETLLHLLESVPVTDDRKRGALRFPIQYVNRPNLDFRGFAGTIAKGEIAVGDAVKVLPSHQTTTVKSIVTFDGVLQSAQAGQAITLTLNDEIDISRGDLMVSANESLTATRQFAAHLVWMSEQSLRIGKTYDIKIAGKTTQGVVTQIRHQVNINTLETFETAALPLNSIGVCLFELTEAVPLDLYQFCTDTGGFIVIDRLSNVTVGAGMVHEMDTPSSPQPTKTYSAFELELNALICKHFPHWQARDLNR